MIESRLLQETIPKLGFGEQSLVGSRFHHLREYGSREQGWS